MKFLMFNIVVAAALVYLFTGGGLDMGAAADRAAHVATKIENKARLLVGAESRPSPQKAAPTQDDKLVAPAPLPARQKPQIAKAERTDRGRQASPRRPVPAKTATRMAKAEETLAKPAPAPVRPAPLVAKAKQTDKTPLSTLPTSVVSSVPAKTPLPPGRSPEVAKRRAIVLGKTADDTMRPEPDRAKSGAERARELMLLAEEMELFSAQAIGQ